MTVAAVECAEVVAVEQVNAAIVEITVRAPELAAAARPGQFAQLRCGDGVVPLLRRPFSVAWTDGDRCGFVLVVTGRGTRRLRALHPGDTVDVLGPLGHGFTVDATPLVCVSGGVGCAPFPLQVRAARAAGAPVTVLSGAGDAARLYPAERFRRGDAEVTVVECTDDGSRGRRGLVTELLDAHLAEHDGAPVRVAACGPNPMLAAAAAVVARRRDAVADAEVSLEAPMGCGFGTCLGCALPVRGESPWALCCTDGPVMPAGAVDWDALMALPRADVA